MVNGFVRICKKLDKAGEIAKRLKILTELEAYVGIPAETSSRGSKGINSAELLYIQSHGARKKAMREEMQESMDSGKTYSAAHSLYVQTHGSPMWHIPPRPVLEPAIEDKLEPIAGKLKEAAQEALKGNLPGVEQNFHKAGMIGEDAAKGWFGNPKNNWPSNSPKTVRQKGSDSPLIDTGEMRKAITYLIERKGEG